MTKRDKENLDSSVDKLLAQDIPAKKHIEDILISLNTAFNLRIRLFNTKDSK